MSRVLIIDYYVDEPACFGVPPYISPYVRYLAGALAVQGYSTEAIDYLTVDRLRTDDFQIEDDYEALFVVAGHTVPGKYLGGKIGSLAEVLRLLEGEKASRQRRPVFIGGPIKFAAPDLRAKIAQAGGLLVRRDLDSFVCSGSFSINKRSYTDAELGENYRTDYEHTNRVAGAGAFITAKHPNFPYVIIELETYRGCTRDTYCSFCTEAFYGRPSFRPLQGLLDEVSQLYGAGNRYFRLGRQADIITYGAHMQDFKNTYPRPNPEQIEALYGGLRSVAPDLKMLHLDNVNPGGLITFPQESAECARIISEYNTPGDTAAMGLETVDPLVVERNSLKVDGAGALQAIAMINEDGARREGGIPKFLPGLNFIGGLPGETEATFAINYRFLEELLASGLLVRRINLRHLVRYAKTRAARAGKNKGADRLRKKFDYYKTLVRKNIDVPMVKKVFPAGTVIPEVIVEQRRFEYALGRPLGSYPMTVKIPGAFTPGSVVNKAVVVAHSERTLIALPSPVPWETLDAKALSLIPGVSARRAAQMILDKPKTPVAEQVARMANEAPVIRSLV